MEKGTVIIFSAAGCPGLRKGTLEKGTVTIWGAREKGTVTI